MEYNVGYSAEAEKDLDGIFQYIAFSLFSPKAAKRIVEKIMKEISALGYMPFSYKQYPNEPWLSRGLRYFPVENYLVFYIPNENDKSVTIIRIMYGGRDIDKQLN